MYSLLFVSVLVCASFLFCFALLRFILFVHFLVRLCISVSFRFVRSFICSSLPFIPLCALSFFVLAYFPFPFP